MSFTSRLKKQIFIQAQRVVPQHQLSRVVGKLAASENPIVKNTVIQAFKAQYGIDMSIAEQSNALKYKSFNDFFTRSLKDGVRAIMLILKVSFPQQMVPFHNWVALKKAIFSKPKVKLFRWKN